MSDLQKYISKRKKTDEEFAKDYDKDFENFKISKAELDRQVREGNKRGKESEKREPRAVAIKHENGRTFVELATGWNFSFYPRVFSELKNASEKDLEQVKSWGRGYTLEWTSLDAHIGIGAIMLKLIGEKYLASELNRQRRQSKRVTL